MDCDSTWVIFWGANVMSNILSSKTWNIQCNQSNCTPMLPHQRCPQKDALLITAWIIIHFTLLTNFVQYLLQCNDKKIPSMGKKITTNCNETMLCIAVQSTTPRVKLFMSWFGVNVEVSSSCLQLQVSASCCTERVEGSSCCGRAVVKTR